MRRRFNACTKPESAGFKPRRLLKMAVQQGRSKRRSEPYSQQYGEFLSAARTPLADFFSNRLVPATCATAAAHPVQRERLVPGLQIGMRAEKALHSRFIGKHILAAPAVVFNRQTVLR